METYLENFSAEGNVLTKGCNKLEELIINRQAKFNLTTKYKETNDKIKDFINQLKDIPEVREIARKLDNEIVWLEYINYSAAYKDGIKWSST
jgi:predicted regulator of amino acid metabolism with ACT domain